MCKTLTLALLALPFALPLARAHADSLTLTLTPTSTTGTAGETITYDATITAAAANTGDLYLNGDTLQFNLAGSSTDDTGLYLDFDAYLTPGESETGDLFTITLPSTLADGTYTGTFVLEGGSSASSETALATDSFTVQVGSTLSSTPEPSSIALLGTGLLGMAGILLRRRQHA